MMERTLSKPLAGQTADEALDAAIGQAAAESVVLSVPLGEHILTRDHVIGENVTLHMQKGARWFLSKGCTLTIQGKVQAGAQLVFDGPGRVAGRIHSEGYVQWFGASNDAPQGQTEAFQKAVDVLEVVLVPETTRAYRIGALRLSHPVTLRGVGNNRVRLDVLRGEPHLFTIASDGVAFENLTVHYDAEEPSEEVAFYFDTSVRNLEGIRLFNVHVDNPAYGVADAKSDRHTINDVSLDKVHFNANRNTGLHMTDFCRGIVLKDVCVASFHHEIPSIGYIFENLQDMFLENVDVLGGYAKWTVRGGHGMVFDHCENVRTYRLMVDYVNGKQLVIKNSRRFHISNFVVSLLKEEGLYFENFTDSVLDVVKSNGNFYDMVNDDPYDSVVLKNCHGLTFNDLIIQYNQRDGLRLEQCSDNVFNNTVIMENAGHSLIESEDCAHNIFNGVISNANKKGGVSICGEDTVIYGLVTNDDRFFETAESPYSDREAQEAIGGGQSVADAATFPWST